MKKVHEAESLPHDSAELLDKMTDEEFVAMAKPLVRLMLEVCDEIATGHDTWMSLGSTKKRSSFVLTLYQYNGPLALFSDDPYALLGSAGELL